MSVYWYKKLKLLLGLLGLRASLLSFLYLIGKVKLIELLILLYKKLR